MQNAQTVHLHLIALKAVAEIERRGVAFRAGTRNDAVSAEEAAREAALDLAHQIADQNPLLTIDELAEQIYTPPQAVKVRDANGEKLTGKGENAAEYIREQYAEARQYLPAAEVIPADSPELEPAIDEALAWAWEKNGALVQELTDRAAT
ncbi:hypothetical protein [Deinococcus frigens]|uniref:hypothetical protein n=1 Tax=Deinococcus frigens TaxID=249403 RepID=UPI0004981863|nr:hypothetical protein [Deinococcus frigens]